ncbi:MAG: hypothetical protein IPK71_36590 [Myxococcales bacterium]|nr:hypothetical protein [Myxococcales bacterium]
MAAAKKATATKALATVKKTVLAGVKKSAAAQKRLASLLETIERRKARIVEDFYDIGVALKEIVDKKLYLQAGYASFGDLIDGRKIMGKTQAFKLVSIARAVPREKAIEVGSEKAYELVRLTEQTPEPDTVEDVLTTGVRGPKGKGTIDVKKLSSREIAQKRRELAKANEKPNDDEIAAKREARLAQAEMRKAGLKVTVEARKEGKVWTAIVSLPLTRLATLSKAAARAAK